MILDENKTNISFHKIGQAEWDLRHRSIFQVFLQEINNVICHRLDCCLRETTMTNTSSWNDNRRVLSQIDTLKIDTRARKTELLSVSYEIITSIIYISCKIEDNDVANLDKSTKYPSTWHDIRCIIRYDKKKWFLLKSIFLMSRTTISKLYVHDDIIYKYIIRDPWYLFKSSMCGTLFFDKIARPTVSITCTFQDLFEQISDDNRRVD